MRDGCGVLEREGGPGSGQGKEAGAAEGGAWIDRVIKNIPQT